MMLPATVGTVVAPRRAPPGWGGHWGRRGEMLMDWPPEAAAALKVWLKGEQTSYPRPNHWKGLRDFAVTVFGAVSGWNSLDFRGEIKKVLHGLHPEMSNSDLAGWVPTLKYHARLFLRFLDHLKDEGRLKE